MRFEPTTIEFRSDALTNWTIRSWAQLAEPTFYSYSNFIVCSVPHFISAVCFRQWPRLLRSKFSIGNHMSVAEWADTYGIQNLQTLWCSYRKFLWERFEPTITEFRSDALTDWAIRLCVPLVLRATFVQLLQFHCLFSFTFHFGSLPLSVATFFFFDVFCK